MKMPTPSLALGVGDPCRCGLVRYRGSMAAELHGEGSPAQDAPSVKRKRLNGKPEGGSGDNDAVWFVGCDSGSPVRVDAALLRDFAPQMLLSARQPPCKTSDHEIHGRIQIHQQRCTQACLLSVVQSMRYGRVTLIGGATLEEVFNELRFQGVNASEDPENDVSVQPSAGDEQKRRSIALPAWSGLVDREAQYRAAKLKQICNAVAHAIAYWPRLATGTSRVLNGGRNMFSCSATSAWIQFIPAPVGLPGSRAPISSIAELALSWPVWLQSYMTIIATLAANSRAGGLPVDTSIPFCQAAPSAAKENPLKDIDCFTRVTQFLMADPMRQFWHVGFDNSKRPDSFKMYEAWSASANWLPSHTLVNRWISEFRRVAEGLCEKTSEADSSGREQPPEREGAWAECYMRWCLEVMENSPCMRTLFSSECCPPGEQSFERLQLAESLGALGLRALHWSDSAQVTPERAVIPSAFPPAWARGGAGESRAPACW